MKNIFNDYNNVYKAMSGDKIALAAIETKYGKINNMGELYKLGGELYEKLNANEKNMADIQIELSLKPFDETEKQKS